MPYRVDYKSSAAATIRKLPRPIQRRILDKVDTLRENPRPHGVKKLQGPDDLYRVRVGDYRVVYQIYDKELAVVVVRVGDRKEIYG